jgi:subtilisin-like proprotein convertase family protein
MISPPKRIDGRSGAIASWRTTLSWRTTWALLVAAWLLAFAFPATASAQAEWVRRIDANGNGYIEPSEVSDRARSFFDRFAGQAGIDLSRPNSVGRMEDAARRYFEQQNRGSSSTPSSVAQNPLPETGVPGFGAVVDSPLVPGFGLPTIRFPYTQADLDEAERSMQRSDRNGDGFIDREELLQGSWREGRPPIEFDADGDGKLNKLEMGQRYAKRRFLEQASARGLGGVGSSSGAVSSEQSAPQPYSEGRRDWRGGGSRGFDRGGRYLAFTLLERYDFSKNGKFEPTEMAATGIEAGKADFNRDGVVELDELSQYLQEEMEILGKDLSEVLPTWFYERDLNSDGQVEMAEFTEQWDDAKIAEFSSHDVDGDGIITARELLSAKSVAGGSYTNRDAKILLPRSVVVSEVQVDDEIVIGDLNVQLSITHTSLAQLDGYLIGPDGQRIELFSGVGGNDDHFDRTIFNDEAGSEVIRSQPPFRGEFKPSGVSKRQPGLSHYHGKSLKGVWQLMVRSSRADRAGILHDWSLIVQPSQESKDQLKGESAVAASEAPVVPGTAPAQEAAPASPPPGPPGAPSGEGDSSERRGRFRRDFSR